jgi:Arc/MetJ family transcription regulator
MKTTIDIDEKNLERVMQLTGARSRRAAVDYALTCTERAERLRKVFEHPLPDEEYLGALADNYDLNAVRKKDLPAWE